MNSLIVQPLKLYDYDIEARIAEKRITLLELSVPVANYVHTVRTGNLVFLADKGYVKPDVGYITGKLGD